MRLSQGMKSRFFNALIDLLLDSLFWLLRVNDDDYSVPASTCPKRTEAASHTIFVGGDHVGILTGLRVGEILGLRWSDVDFGSAQLRVSQRCYRGEMDSPKTRASQRTLPLSPECIQALKQLQAGFRPEQKDTLVFRTSKGTPYSDTNILHRELKPAGQKIDAPWLSWHTFRRTHATLLQLAGGSLKDAQAQLGHSRLSTTLEIYTIPLPDHQREAVHKLSQLVTNSDEFAEIAEGLPMPTQQIQ